MMISSRAIVFSVLCLSGSARVALAGPNAGGVLALHANPSLSWTAGGDYCSQSAVDSCIAVVSSVEVEADRTTIVHVVALFPPESTPRLRGTSFGVSYDSTKIEIVAQGGCADFELPTSDWPLPDSGISLTWNTTRTAHAEEICWFAVYQLDNTPTILMLRPHPQQHAPFADDTQPASVTDEATYFGYLGFGMTGLPSCPFPTVAEKMERRDTFGEAHSPSADDSTSIVPNRLVMKVVPGALPDVWPGTRSIATHEFTDEAIRACLTAAQASSVHKLHPSAIPGGELGVTTEGRTVRLADLSTTLTVEYQADVRPQDLARDLSGSSAVLWAEPVRSRTAESGPNDQWYEGNYAQRWQLERLGYPPGGPWSDILTSPPDWRIGFLDTGIGHWTQNGLAVPVELGGGVGVGKKVRSATNVVIPGGPMDDDCAQGGRSHGTAMAALAGAVTNNQLRMASLAGGWVPETPGPELVVIKVIGYNEPLDGCLALSDDIALGVLDAVGSHTFDGQPSNCRLINCSFGSAGYSEVEREALLIAHLLGRTVVASKGNRDTENWHFPSDYDSHWILSVGAMNQADLRRVSQIIQGDWGSNYGRGIDLVVPGSDMQVLNADESGSYNIAGTSAATALATSGAALLQMVTDDVLAPEDIQGALRAVARDIEADHALPGVTLTGYDKYTGAGECRVAPAVSALAAGRLIQCRTAAGVATLGDPQLGVWTIPPLNLDAQLCYAYEATADVTFPAMVATPSVWGVGRWTGGTSLSNPNYGEGWCEVMPGSLSATGCTLRTYLLKLVIGWPVVELWWPCAPEDLTFGYTILGEVSVAGMPETAHVSEPKIRVLSQASNAPVLWLNGVSAKPTTLQVFDAAGRLRSEILGVAMSGDTRFDLDRGSTENSRLPSGAYWARVKTEHGSGSAERVVIVR